EVPGRVEVHRRLAKEHRGLRRRHHAGAEELLQGVHVFLVLADVARADLDALEARVADLLHGPAYASKIRLAQAGGQARLAQEAHPLVEPSVRLVAAGDRRRVAQAFFETAVELAQLATQPPEQLLGRGQVDEEFRLARLARGRPFPRTQPDDLVDGFPRPRD